MKATKKITIGHSDYSRKQMLSGEANKGFGYSANLFLEAINEYEKEGYSVIFETSFLRKIFGFGTYKITAYKN